MVVKEVGKLCGLFFMWLATFVLGLIIISVDSICVLMIGLLIARIGGVTFSHDQIWIALAATVVLNILTKRSRTK